MFDRGRGVVSFLVLIMIAFAGCTSSQNTNVNSSKNSDTTASKPKPDEEGIIRSGAGTEKEKPAAGKSNVQGKVFYNGKPAEAIEVKLCEKFSQYVSGCGGQTYTTKTDANGEYLIKDVPPGLYEGLTAKVFNTPYYVFATSGIVSSAKYRIDADETFFAPDTNLFKSDLKVTNPKAGSKISGKNVEIVWDAYPDAAYYKFSVHADTTTGAKMITDYLGKRVDGVSYILDQELTAGNYTCNVTAYNSNNIKLADSQDGVAFTVIGPATK